MLMSTFISFFFQFSPANDPMEYGDLSPRVPRLWSIQKFQDRYVKMLAFSNRPRDHKISDEDH